MAPTAPRVGLITLALIACMSISLWNFHDEGLSWKSVGLSSADALGDESNIQALVQYSTTGASGPTAHAIFAADKATDKFCMTMKIAMSEGWQPQVVNWGHLPNPNGNIAKIMGYLMYLQDSVIPDDDIVYLMDAFDVWLQVGPEEASRRYLAVESKYGRGPVLVSAEKNCWPFEATDDSCRNQPNSTLPESTYGSLTDLTTETQRPRFLNSGTFIGRKSDVIEMLAKTQARLENGQTYNGDQQAMALIYLEEGQNMFRLDYEQDIAMTMHMALDDLIFMPDRSVIRDGKLRGWNRFTGTQPVAIHWNGRGKGGPMENTYRTTHPVYSAILNDDQVFITQAGEKLSFNSICKNLSL